MSDEAFMLVDPFDGDGPEVFYDACNEIERLEGLVFELTDALAQVNESRQAWENACARIESERDAFEALYKGRADVATFIAERDEARVQREEYAHENEQLRSERDDLLRAIAIVQEQRNEIMVQREEYGRENERIRDEALSGLVNAQRIWANERRYLEADLRQLRKERHDLFRALDIWRRRAETAEGSLVAPHGIDKEQWMERNLLSVVPFDPNDTGISGVTDEEIDEAFPRSLPITANPLCPHCGEEIDYAEIRSFVRRSEP